MNTPNRGSEPACPGFQHIDGCGPEMPVIMPSGQVAWARYAPGRTLREHFAGLAMQGMLADPSRNQPADQIVEIATKFADALIAELGK